MPQITLEYTDNIPPIDFRRLFMELHRIVAEEGGVNIGNCKSRAQARDVFLIADGGVVHAFIHVSVGLMEGRTPDWISRIGNLFLIALQQAYAAIGETLEIQITVEFRDFDRARYFKHSEGTFTQ